MCFFQICEMTSHLVKDKVVAPRRLARFVFAGARDFANIVGIFSEPGSVASAPLPQGPDSDGRVVSGLHALGARKSDVCTSNFNPSDLPCTPQPEQKVVDCEFAKVVLNRRSRM